MNLQDKLKQGAAVQAPRIVLYGIPGIGKSTFASTAPNPVFVPTEDGLSALKHIPQFPVAKTAREFEDNISSLINEEHNFKTVIIDTADWLENLLCEDILRESKGLCMQTACGGYGAAWGVLKNRFRSILQKLEYFRDNRIMVVFIAHSSIQKISTPESGEFDQYSLKLNHGTNKSPGGIAAMLVEWADAVLFLTRKNGSEKGASVGGERILRTVTTMKAECKNRWGLPDTLEGADINWSTILNYYRKSVSKEN